jgi:hypothetical protein
MTPSTREEPRVLHLAEINAFTKVADGYEGRKTGFERDKVFKSDRATTHP